MICEVERTQRLYCAAAVRLLRLLPPSMKSSYLFREFDCRPQVSMTMRGGGGVAVMLPFHPTQVGP